MRVGECPGDDIRRLPGSASFLHRDTDRRHIGRWAGWPARADDASDQGRDLARAAPAVTKATIPPECIGAAFT
jgi:hypothetical protein